MSKVSKERFNQIKSLSRKGMANGNMLRDCILYAEQSRKAAEDEYKKNIDAANEEKDSFESARDEFKNAESLQVDVLENMIGRSPGFIVNYLMGLVEEDIIEQDYARKLLALHASAGDLAHKEKEDSNPEAECSEEPPPADGSEETPPADGSEETPPADGSEETPDEVADKVLG